MGAGAAGGPGISNAIAQITSGNIFGIPGTIVTVGLWRVDRQNAPGGGFVNVSVQRNGVGSPSTVATVFVPDAYNLGPPGPHHGAAAALQHTRRMRELERAVRRGLEQSFATYALPPGVPAMLGGHPNNSRSISRFEVHGDWSN
jgi:hypothetical protein